MNATAETHANDEFDARVDNLLQTTCEVTRALVGVHQATMAMIVAGDWTHARKYFSLSEKYAQWKEFTMPRAASGSMRSSSQRTRPSA